MLIIDKDGNQAEITQFIDYGDGEFYEWREENDFIHEYSDYELNYDEYDELVSVTLKNEYMTILDLVSYYIYTHEFWERESFEINGHDVPHGEDVTPAQKDELFREVSREVLG